ncbi:bifunctional 2-polyprenyl-6-hydroxyphenol methylase/3-demethylubiquinol 3-O-methyltransferase UbiG [Paracoccaceae bacterium]|nr:bifunctional 2-polyprenyl-6-hydroxyphenol methylase/3-demethylubiquinol 3-O-methyltransferase UbiG [Paracoccaceae bacterium]
METVTSINTNEVRKFEQLADEWWNIDGKFKPLHMLNPCRLKFITEHLSIHFKRDLLNKEKPLKGITILDIGCGGGLLCEPLARLGAHVLGIDVVEKNVKVAKIHAKKMCLNINYRHISAEDLIKEKKRFDVVLNMEVIEHVDNPSQFIKSCSELLSKNGLIFCSTINRNLKSYVFAILGAEYVMRWLPRGTHEWKKFFKPNELKTIFSQAGLNVEDTKGFVFNPISWSWNLSKEDFTVNYAICATK